MQQLNNVYLGKADVLRGGNHMYRCRMKIAVFSKDAALIFCGSRQRIGTFPSEEFEAADEFWETPFVRDYIKVRLKRIMEQINWAAIITCPGPIWIRPLTVACGPGPVTCQG